MRNKFELWMKIDQSFPEAHVIVFGDYMKACLCVNYSMHVLKLHPIWEQDCVV